MSNVSMRWMRTDVSDGRRHGSPLVPSTSTLSMAVMKTGWLRASGIGIHQSLCHWLVVVDGDEGMGSREG